MSSEITNIVIHVDSQNVTQPAHYYIDSNGYTEASINTDTPINGDPHTLVVGLRLSYAQLSGDAGASHDDPSLAAPEDALINLFVTWNNQVSLDASHIGCANCDENDFPWGSCLNTARAHLSLPAIPGIGGNIPPSDSEYKKPAGNLHKPMPE